MQENVEPRWSEIPSDFIYALSPDEPEDRATPGPFLMGVKEFSFQHHS